MSEALKQQMRLRKDPTVKKNPKKDYRDPARRNRGVIGAKLGAKEKLKELRKVLDMKGESPPAYSEAIEPAWLYNKRKQGKPLKTEGIENMPGVSETAKLKFAVAMPSFGPVLRDVGRYAPLGAAAGAGVGALTAGEGESKGQKAMQYGLMGAGLGGLGGALMGEGAKPFYDKAKDWMDAPAAKDQAAKSQAKATQQVAAKKPKAPKTKPRAARSKSLVGPNLTAKGKQQATALKAKQKNKMDLGRLRRIKKLGAVMDAVRKALASPGTAAAAGAGLGAAGGGALGALTAKKDEEGKRRRGSSALRGALVGAGLGAAGGAGGSALAKHLKEKGQTGSKIHHTLKATSKDKAPKSAPPKTQKERNLEAIKKRQGAGQAKSKQHDAVMKGVHGKTKMDFERAEDLAKEVTTGEKTKPKRKKRSKRKKPNVRRRPR